MGQLTSYLPEYAPALGTGAGPKEGLVVGGGRPILSKGIVSVNFFLSKTLERPRGLWDTEVPTHCLVQGSWPAIVWKSKKWNVWLYLQFFFFLEIYSIVSNWLWFALSFHFNSQNPCWMGSDQVHLPSPPFPLPSGLPAGHAPPQPGLAPRPVCGAASGPLALARVHFCNSLILLWIFFSEMTHLVPYLLILRNWTFS